jgi:hypothetical protein
MIASKVTREVLLQAAEQIRVRAEVEAKSQSGKRFRVKLFPLITPELLTPAGHRRTGERGDSKYQRESVGYGSAGRRVSAVCWHGFRDYFRAVFEQTPEAVFRTSLDKWDGSEDFEKRFPESGHKNIGPRVAPVAMADACRCPERGYAG